MMLLLLGLGLGLGLLSPPAEAWYKQAAGPSYYSVGRASGLLSGFRRSPYSRRSDGNSIGADSSAGAESGPPAADPSFVMPEPRQSPGRQRSMAPCVKEVTPELQSCQLVPGLPSLIQCRAEVTVSLDSADCSSPGP